MNTLQNKIKHFQDLSFNVVDFETYKDMLIALGYDINLTYAKKWGTSNMWDGESCISTKCFYLGTDIAYCNVAGDHLKDEVKLKALCELRKEYCFYFGNEIYMV